LYQKRLKLSTSSGRDLTLVLPEGLPFQDEYFGDVIIYRSELSVVFDIDRMDRDLEDGKVLLEYQGCADAGYCYPPQKHWIALW
jgi:thiol:disulfide interchange protein DsbD